MSAIASLNIIQQLINQSRHSVFRRLVGLGYHVVYGDPSSCMLRLRKYNANDVVRFGVVVKSENAVDLFLIVFFCFDYNN